MRIGLITTLNTNIGDDFIREGICIILREVFKGRDIEFVAINKHYPMTAYPIWHPVHLEKITQYLPRGSFRASSLIKQFAPKLRLSKFDNCELIVQCGAPVLWPNCHQCEWGEPLWHKIIGRLFQHIQVLNLAAGSCFPWEQQPAMITDQEDAQYLHEIFGYCKLTTVRDILAQRLYSSLDACTPLIPCSAFIAAKGHFINGQNKGVVLINYMAGGGHYDWNQGIDPAVWHNIVSTLIDRLSRRHSLAFLCHNETEYQLARELSPEIPRLFPKTVREYFTLVSEAKLALCNRMHASVGLAGLGIPSIAIGTDTRLLMVKALELPCLYVKEADVDQLEDKLEGMIAQFPKERERLLALQSETWNKYILTVSEAIRH